MARSAFVDLAVLESHDVVKTTYEGRHGGSIPAGKVAEVASCFSQGRQYLASAASAGELVSPLLVYYGLNALARGAVLFLDIKARIATMKPAHGLGVPSWQEDLATGLDRFADLKINIDPSGTFSEFTRVTSGDTITAVTSDHKQIELPSRSTAVIPANASVTIKDVVSRIPDIQDIYEAVLQEAPNIFAAGVSYSLSGEISAEIFGERIPPDIAAIQRNVLELAAVVPLVKSDSGSRGRPSATFTSAMAPNDIRLPLRSSGGVNWFVVPFAPALDLSLLSIYYLLSYATGMLCRYFPQHWLALLRGSRGDRLYPIVREAQDIVTRQFQVELAGRLLLP